MEYTTQTIESIAANEYVRRIRAGKMSNETFKRGAYDKASKSYSLVSCDDMNKEVFVKRGTMLAVGFTY